MSKSKRYSKKKQALKKEKKVEKKVEELSAKDKAKEEIKARIDKEDTFFIFWPQGDVAWTGLPSKARLIGFLQTLVYQDFDNPVFSNLYRHLYGAKAVDLKDSILDGYASRQVSAPMEKKKEEEVEEFVEESQGDGVAEEEVESLESEEVFEDEDEDEDFDEEELEDELTEEELAMYEKLKAKAEKSQRS